MPVEKNAELCNFIRIEQIKKGMEDRRRWVGEKRSERGNGGKESEANRRTAVGQKLQGNKERGERRFLMYSPPGAAR